MRQPFWTDEAWVAVTTRFPLTQLPHVTSSTPIGWSVLIRLIPFGGNNLRLVPLAFSAGTVASAYWFGRRLGWAEMRISVGAGIIAAIAALLVPAMLVRSDLKQYTADACLALVVMALTSRVERDWGRKPLAALGGAVVGGMLFSHTTAFVGVAAFASLTMIQLVRRAWRPLLESVAVGAITAIGMLGVYSAFDARAVIPGLTQYWAGYYVPVHQGIRASLHFLRIHIEQQEASLGLGPAWVIVVLVIAGLVTLLRLGRPATALTVVVLWVEMVVLAAARKYPFLDQRTSTFVFVVTIVVAAVGVVGICTLVMRWVTPLGAAALAATLVVTFTIHVEPEVRVQAIPVEDVQSPVDYIVAHRASQDVVLVNAIGNFAFAYYWPFGHPSATDSTLVLQRYLAVFPDQRQLVIARGRSLEAVADAVGAAETVASQHPQARIWVIRSHLSSAEAGAWQVILAARGLTLEPIGPSGLTMLQPG
ncbi:MAG: hypothetical protein M3O28_13665, partial [Actinomycetota bacterium]|nr:hypothetical protein [Actinomycetota bacterium]